MSRKSFIVPAILIILTSPAALADIDDGHGKLWRQVTETTNLTWNQVALVCPTDGHTPANGSIGPIDFTGWIWATRDQVRQLLSYWQPEILENPTLQGPNYFLSALYFTSTFTPTWSVYIESFSGQAVRGWTATANEDGTVLMAAVGASWPVYNGSWTVAASGPPDVADPINGFWFWRSASRPGDVDSDGDVDLSDLAALLAAFGACTGDANYNPHADFDANNCVELADLAVLLGNFGS